MIMTRLSEIKNLIKQSRSLFGSEFKMKYARHQWILATDELMRRGIHLKQTGKYPAKVTKQIKSSMMNFMPEFRKQEFRKQFGTVS